MKNPYEFSDKVSGANFLGSNDSEILDRSRRQLDLFASYSSEGVFFPIGAVESVEAIQTMMASIAKNPTSSEHDRQVAEDNLILVSYAQPYEKTAA
jgi:hypothetical protein